MTMLKTLTTQPIFVRVAGVLLTTALVVCLAVAFFLHGTSHAFAATLQQATGTTCAQAPSSAHCDNLDPEVQGCAADAQTIDQADIKENGFVIGRVERRFSQVCNSWWGRVFDTRPDSQANMFITVNGTTLSASPTFVSGSYRILYSSMVFDASPTQTVPAITGTVEIDGITAAPSATLNAITIPPHM